MIQGTTPTHVFQLPFSTDLIEEIQVTYVQGEEEILQKTTDDIIKEGDTIRYSLTQEETFLFDHRKIVKIQIRVLLTDGTVMASAIFTARVDKCLDDEVL